MENASKALMIVAGILIAILVISIGIYLFTDYRDMGSAYEQNLSTAEIQKFNVNFTKFEGRQDIKIQEIVTLVNFVQQYREKNEISEKNDITIIIENQRFQKSTINGKKIIKDSIEDLIKVYLDESFTCVNIKYDNDGKVNEIYFSTTLKLLASNL